MAAPVTQHTASGPLHWLYPPSGLLCSRHAPQSGLCSVVPTSERDPLWPLLHPIHHALVFLLPTRSTPVPRKKAGSALGPAPAQGQPWALPQWGFIDWKHEGSFHLYHKEENRGAWHLTKESTTGPAPRSPQLSGEWSAENLDWGQSFVVPKAGFRSIFLLWNP